MRVARDLAAALAGPDGRLLLQTALDAGPLEIRAAGVSMSPLLRAGDRVRLERIAPRRGDVAMVEISDRIILHRLVRRRCRRWLVRGDARSSSDGWVASRQILAIATARRRDGDPRSDARWKRLDHPAARLLGLVAGPLARIVRGCIPWRPHLPPARRNRLRS